MGKVCILILILIHRMGKKYLKYFKLVRDLRNLKVNYFLFSNIFKDKHRIW